MKSYSAVSEEDPYGEMPEYYRSIIINSKNNKIALIGFIGTIPEYRKKGICKQLMKQVLNDLKDKDTKLAYLQTEEGYIPEKLYSNIGFKKICNAIIAVENKGN